MKRLGSKIIADYAKIRKQVRHLHLLDKRTKEEEIEFNNLLDKTQQYQNNYPTLCNIIDL